MNQKLKVFSKQLMILSVFTGLAIFAATKVIPPEYITPALPFLLVFFIATTLLSFLFLQKKIEGSPSGFVTAFMANSAIRLMFSLAIIVVYALTNRPDSVNFILSFFILYVIFTAFEVTFFLRKKNETGK